MVTYFQAILVLVVCDNFDLPNQNFNFVTENYYFATKI